MSIAKTLYGIGRVIPQTPERNWGSQVTSILADMIDGLDATTGLISGIGVLRAVSTTNSLAAGATLTVTHPWHRIQSTGGAVVLDGTTAIADGSFDGQLLFLSGTSDVNTVEIPDGANTQLNGLVVLTNGDSITLQWDAAGSVWQEKGRNN